MPIALCACSADWKVPDSGSTQGKSTYTLEPGDFKLHDDYEITADKTGSPNQVAPIAVQKGDVLLIQASGTLDTPLGTLGPAGNPAFGGLSYVLVNRRAFGLYGKIHDSVFPIGKDSALIAPDSGEIELIVNGCAGCATSGQFTVTVHSLLQDGVKLATQPSVSDNSVTSTHALKVDASAGWSKSGITLEKGRKVFVSSNGSFVADGKTYDADGSPGLGGSNYQLLMRRVYRLHARIGEEIVELGTSAAFLSPANGELELMINNAGDASGVIAVQIDEGVVPARGLVAIDGDEHLGRLVNATVSPKSGWHTTTMNVNRGDPILVHATGQLTGSSVPDAPLGPFGSPGIGGTWYALINYPVYALHGRIGNEAFFLGGENALLAPATGTLELIINDVQGCSSCAGDCQMKDGSGCVPCTQCDVAGQFDATLQAPEAVAPNAPK